MLNICQKIITTFETSVCKNPTNDRCKLKLGPDVLGHGFKSFLRDQQVLAYSYW